MTESTFSESMRVSAERITQCYEALQAINSNVVLELLKTQEKVYQWKHYPAGDVLDKTTYSQYYYHSHPSKDADRVPEHGHFHLFMREPGINKKADWIYASKPYLNDPKRKKDNLCHIVAIAMNPFGFPTALFTTNHWVTRGLWYQAEDVCQMLDHFVINNAEPNYTNIWITAMVHLFKDHIKALLFKRDEIIDEWKKTHPDSNVFEDRHLEITSVCSLTEAIAAD